MMSMPCWCLVDNDLREQQKLTLCEWVFVSRSVDFRLHAVCKVWFELPLGHWSLDMLLFVWILFELQTAVCWHHEYIIWGTPNTFDVPPFHTNRVRGHWASSNLPAPCQCEKRFSLQIDVLKPVEDRCFQHRQILVILKVSQSTDCFTAFYWFCCWRGGCRDHFFHSSCFCSSFIASCVHFDGRVMSSHESKISIWTPSASPSHRCIFPFGEALYAWCTTGLWRHRFMKIPKIPKIPRNCEAVQAICIDSEEDLQPFTKQQQKWQNCYCSKTTFEHIWTTIRMNWIRLVLWHFMLAWWHKEPSFASGNAGAAKET